MNESNSYSNPGSVLNPYKFCNGNKTALQGDTSTESLLLLFFLSTDMIT